MPLPPPPLSLRFILQVLCSLAGLLLLACLSYWPGLNGPFLLDDYPNLHSIGDNGGIQSFNDALRFITNGNAGVMGRSLSLASFLIHDNTWPTDPWPFKFTGLMLHLLNGLLIFWLILWIGRTQNLTDKALYTFALFVTGMWLLHPMNISTTLYVIQRMTELATLFTLAGLICFIKGRKVLSDRPTQAFFLMSAGIGIMGPLATLSKESGFLIIMYAWVVELTLFKDNPSSLPRLYTPWKVLFFYFPMTALLVYIFFVNQLSGYDIRLFTLSERLLTQPGVLTHYLGHILSPNLIGSGLFHDDYPLSTGLLHPPSTLLYILGIIALILLAWFARKKWPVFSFGVLWFFVGHLLESTVLPLEIYFEHRNYLPMLGILSIVGFYAVRTPIRLRALVNIAFLIIISTFAFSNWQNSLVWGNARIQAKVWADENPASMRAQQLYASTLTRLGEFNKARNILLHAQKYRPLEPSLPLQVIYLDCIMDEPSPYEISRLQTLFKHSELSFAVVETIRRILKRLHSHGCQTITRNELIILLNSLIENPKYQAIKKTLANLYFLKGDTYITLNQIDPSLEALDKSFSYDPRSETLVLQGRLFASAGLFKKALKRIEKARQLEFGKRYPDTHRLKEIAQLKALIQADIRSQ